MAQKNSKKRWFPTGVQFLVIREIVGAYHAWRGDKDAADNQYADVPGFCKSATTAEIAGHGYILTPGRYVGAEEVEVESQPFDEKMKLLMTELRGQFTEASELEQKIGSNLRGLGYDW